MRKNASERAAHQFVVMWFQTVRARVVKQKNAHYAKNITIRPGTSGLYMSSVAGLFFGIVFLATEMSNDTFLHTYHPYLSVVVLCAVILCATYMLSRDYYTEDVHGQFLEGYLLATQLDRLAKNDSVAYMAPELLAMSGQCVNASEALKTTMHSPSTDAHLQNSKLAGELYTVVRQTVQDAQRVVNAQKLAEQTQREQLIFATKTATVLTEKDVERVASEAKLCNELHQHRQHLQPDSTKTTRR